VRTERPTSLEEAAEAMRAAGTEGASVRFRGRGTKMGWGTPVSEPDVELSTGGLDALVEHNVGDLTAVLLAGMPLAGAQAAFAEAGQMMAVDPPLGGRQGATVGGVVATGDSGPLRHRYGGPRDLLLGVTVALSDGTVARSGGKVIKNVAGYDLAKLFTGSFGTLGLVVQVAVRLHPVPVRRVTATGETDDPLAAQAAVVALARAPLELECLDVRWRSGRGGVLARCGGAAPEVRARQALALLAAESLAGEVVEDDDDLWAAQRDDQRSPEGVVVRVSGQPASLATVLRTADREGGSIVGRAGAGLSWITLGPRSVEDAVGAVEEVRRALNPSPCAVLDAPLEVREKVDVWGSLDGPVIELSRRLKVGFDPAGICSPGVFVGGI
jgi:glycolate oxidase FAD binding subunit